MENVTKEELEHYVAEKELEQTMAELEKARAHLVGAVSGDSNELMSEQAIAVIAAAGALATTAAKLVGGGLSKNAAPLNPANLFSLSSLAEELLERLHQFDQQMTILHAIGASLKQRNS